MTRQEDETIGLRILGRALGSLGQLRAIEWRHHWVYQHSIWFGSDVYQWSARHMLGIHHQGAASNGSQLTAVWQPVVQETAVVPYSL
jgi:hypothetical protein